MAFEPETNQGFQNVETKLFNTSSVSVLNNLQFVGNATKLFNGTIQSPNYERGTRGWCLYANGDVDFPGI